MKTVSKKYLGLLIGGAIAAGLAITASLLPASFVQGETPPSKPENLSTEVRNDSVTIQWTEPKDLGGAKEVSDYIVEIRSEIQGTIYIDKVLATTLTVSKLSEDNYVVSVIAETEFGQSDESSVSLTIKPSEPTATPNTPLKFAYDEKLAEAENTLALTWEPPTKEDPAVDYFVVTLVNLKTNQKTTANIKTGGEASYTFAELYNGEYRVSLVAVSPDGAESDPALLSAKLSNGKDPSELPKPFTPQKLSYNEEIAKKGNVISLTWSPLAEKDPAVDMYTIVVLDEERKTSSTYTTTGDATSYATDTLANGKYSVSVYAVNANGVSSDAATVSVTLINGSNEVKLTISNITIDQSEKYDRATISWNTTLDSDSIVVYGPGRVYEKAKAYDPAETTKHSLQISDLFPCTIYSYQVRSSSSKLSSQASETGTFVTGGCVKQSAIQIYSTKVVEFKNLGETVNLINAKDEGKVVIEKPMTSAVESLVIQMKKLEVVETKDFEAEDRQLATQDIFDIKAYADESTIVSQFDESVTVTLNFVPSELSKDLNLETLAIWNSEDDGSTWQKLSGCYTTIDSVNDDGNVTCNTSQFSLFAIFGEPKPADNGGGGDNGGGNNGGGDNNNGGGTPTQPSSTTASGKLLAIANKSQPGTVVYEPFMNNLAIGMRNGEVLKLQILLNKLGYLVSEGGVGAPGYETEYFGPKTMAAVKKLQQDKRSEILEPAQIQNPTGFFGPYTRSYLNIILKQEAGIK